MTTEVREAYGVMVANNLTAQLGRVVGVKLVANSPWTITAWIRCATCGAWFELRRRNQKRCEWCRQRQEKGGERIYTTDRRSKKRTP